MIWPMHSGLPMGDKYIELTVGVAEPFVELVADLLGNMIGEGVEIGTDRVIVRTEQPTAPIVAELEKLDPSIGISIQTEEKIYNPLESEALAPLINSIE